MAKFEDHIEQAKKNLHFLQQTNQLINTAHDWQVTICFYVGVHLINAHLARHGSQYRKHVDANHAVNPEVEMSITKIPEEEYKAYIKLQNLSRRSRYLCNENLRQLGDDQAFFTYSKHVARAIRHLDKLIKFFSDKYGLEIGQYTIQCPDLNRSEPLYAFEVN